MFEIDHKVLRRLLLPTLFMLAGPALADVQCSNTDRSTWMNESDFREYMKDRGVQITKFLITPGNCYEIYGFDKSGRKIEVYSNPVDGTPVAEINPESDA
ncbi:MULTISPECIES: PepSY domain-containing protein [Pseudomonadaceae]|uniref:PepSY domain-containing protein n=1 Tax=Pseudomonadaceae TaxID=135621 RepID=UPI000CA85ED2|nr:MULTISPECIES: PepSY domain-containing protein [Pseudomonadaceae]PJE39767.1 MAG: PepSY domain-containing protein [Pseudomonas sp.] [Pseudomonas sp. FEMGT703P]